MPIHSATTGTAGTTDAPGGLIAGHLLRLTREHLGLTQEAAADALGVDVDTLRSWETGRRPLFNMTVGKLSALLRRLRALGADRMLLAHLKVAIEADLFVAHVLLDGGRGNPADHMLAGWVSTRAWSDLLAWTLVGTEPKALAGLTVPGQRRGPAPSRPELAVPVRDRFFDALRTTADRAADGDASAVLLRRQVYFMTAWDPGSRDWLAKAERAELRQVQRHDGWTPGWVAARSLAVARACQGDREQLRHFIANQLVSDQAEAANLNYWSYWIGEAGGEATSDAFMATGDLGAWRGTALLRHLTDGLRPTTPYLELSIHSVWALLGRRPQLLNDDHALTADLHRRAGALLDFPDLSPPARRELEQVRFLTNAAKGSRR
jgi:transcriptional regulator with XRE-family HTH domain